MTLKQVRYHGPTAAASAANHKPAATRCITSTVWHTPQPVNHCL